ncbi:MAG: hypothetical protein R3Y06_01755 [Faecalibacterium sp.]
MKSDYTILVSSCDAYRDLWDPFFTILKANWPELAQQEIILNTEEETYAFEGLQVRTLGLYQNKAVPTWSQRLKDHLLAIESEYVLFLLEDFFLEAPVDQSKIDACLGYLQQNNQIAHFSFVPTLWECIEDGKFEGYVRRKQATPYKVNTQIGLWRKKELLALLRMHESPWEFEIYSNIRARLRPRKYYCAIKGQPQAFTYDAVLGGAVHRGKWTPIGVELLQKHGIEIDLSVRGMDDKPCDLSELDVRTEDEQTVLGRLKIRLNVIRKHWRSLI